MTLIIQARGKGWRRDLPDHRDYLYTAPVATLQALPQSVDLRAQCPPIYDQSQLGSCVANAIAAALEFDQMHQQLPLQFVPSRLFIYFNARKIEHTIYSDSGVMIRDGIRTVVKQGACPESLWQYDITKYAVQPPQPCYENAVQHKALVYRRVLQNLNQMKAVLASGYPVVFGATLYESFEDAETMQSGDVPMPGMFESVLGGHCMLLVGYDDASQRFYLRNSWGAAFGSASAHPGYGTIPYAYLLSPDLAADFWMVQTVS